MASTQFAWEEAISTIKTYFSELLKQRLQLQSISGPLLVESHTGINDNLSGTEIPLSFELPESFRAKSDSKTEEFKIISWGERDHAHSSSRRVGVERSRPPLIISEKADVSSSMKHVEKSSTRSVAEVVHSLAKWKRLKLKQLACENEFGIVTDMRAIRTSEELSPLHSFIVSQWDWEVVNEDRSLSKLQKYVRTIYSCLVDTEKEAARRYPTLVGAPVLPETITFIHAEDLLQSYPDKTPKEREHLIAEKFGAVFLIGIGGALSNGLPHDARSPDYDDWTTPWDLDIGSSQPDMLVSSTFSSSSSSSATASRRGLNGDIILWDRISKRSIEITSMATRVNKESLMTQLKLCGEEKRQHLYFHRQLLEDQLPQTTGGGIGQDRVTMFMLRCVHIGQVQVGVWPQEMVEEYKNQGIEFL